MNKVFFVVFLGVILGAMTLIFVNQTSSPLASMLASHQAGSPEEGAGTPGQGGADSKEAISSQTPPAVPQPDVAKPLPSNPEAAKPAPANVAPAKPVQTPPELAKPEVVRPEASKPEIPKPESVLPESAKPVVSTPEPVKPEAPVAEPAKPEVAKPEVPMPEPVKPEAVKPEAPSVPAEPSHVEKPGASNGEPGKKTLTLINMGLHFRGNGMVLRIEADAPFSYKTFALSSPDRYVVDLMGTWTNMHAPTIPANTLIKGVRVGKQASGPRLVLDIQRPSKKHSVTWISPMVLEIVIE